jgi:hypothetical protein
MTNPITAPPGPAPRAPTQKSIMLGLLSFAPLTACGLALAAWGFTAWRMAHAPFDADPAGIGGGFAFFALMAVVAGITSLAAFVALLVDAFTNPRVPADQRIMWVLVLLFASLLGFPVYWYVVWWREPRLNVER